MTKRSACGQAVSALSPRMCLQLRVFGMPDMCMIRDWLSIVGTHIYARPSALCCYIILCVH